MAYRFESGHRHQHMNSQMWDFLIFAGSFLILHRFFFPRISSIFVQMNLAGGIFPEGHLLSREHIENRIGRCYLGAVVHMGVNIECCGDVAVSEPLLDLLHADAICVEQTGAAMPLRYNYDKPEMPRISKGFWDCQAYFSSFSNLKNQATK